MKNKYQLFYRTTIHNEIPTEELKNIMKVIKGLEVFVGNNSEKKKELIMLTNFSGDIISMNGIIKKLKEYFPEGKYEVFSPYQN